MKKLFFAVLILLSFTNARSQNCCNGYVLYKPLNVFPGMTGFTSNSVCPRTYNDSRYVILSDGTNSGTTGTLTPFTNHGYAHDTVSCSACAVGSDVVATKVFNAALSKGVLSVLPISQKLVVYSTDSTDTSHVNWYLVR